MTQEARLSGRVALVTGAANGIGKSEALLLARNGATVVASDIDESALAVSVQQGEANGLRICGMRHDVSVEEDWKAVVGEIIERYGRIDILVNNAAIFELTPMAGISSEAWDRVFAVTLRGAFLGIKEVVPYMVGQNRGVIINTSSLAGKSGSGIAHYGAAKAALSSLTRDAAISYAAHGVRVNTVIPGLIDTQMVSEILKHESWREKLVAGVPLGFIGTPEDVAHGVLYLVSDEARFVTGTELIIDGGTYAQ